MPRLRELHKEDVCEAFAAIDASLREKTAIVILGAAALLMLDVVECGTIDIDVADVRDAARFRETALRLGFMVDIVTVSSTVDFNSGEQPEVFHGEKLAVFSVNERDLIKLKLERFRKQDPQDIARILQKTKLPFAEFQEIACEALADYVGDRRTLALSILIAAEDHYPPPALTGLRKNLAL